MSDAVNPVQPPAPRTRKSATAPLPPPTAWEQWRFIVIAVGMITICVTFIVGTFYVMRQVQNAKREAELARAQLQSGATQPSTAGNPNQQSDAAAGISAGVPARPTTGVIPEPIIAYQARLRRYQGRLIVAADKLKTVKREVYRWGTEYAELLDSEVGKRIAADEAAVGIFMSLLDLKRPSIAELDNYQTRLDGILTPVKATLESSPVDRAQHDELEREISTVNADVEELEESLTHQREAVESLIAAASSAAPAAHTLGSAVMSRRRKAAEKFAAELQAAQLTAKQQTEALIIAAEKDAIAALGKANAEARKLLGESEAAALIAEAKLRHEKVETELAAKKAAQRLEELKKRAADPEVQRRYAAFLDKGKVLFDVGANLDSGKGERLLPVSWHNLNRNKWLDSVELFARGMSSDAFSGVKNDRRVAVYPRTEAEWTEMERLFEDFKALGPIWVEMGLLQP